MRKSLPHLLVLLVSFVSSLTSTAQTSTVDFEDFRPIHMGGNWGGNNTNLTVANPPVYSTDYFTWINKVGANWIGISISMHLENSLDSTIERDYSAQIPTFTDDVLRATIQKFRAEGIHVYLTLAFETQEAEASQFPFKRWMLGNPRMPDQTLLPENWPWALDHPKHKSFLNGFFRTYTEQATHFATIAEQEGVELFSLGTETENLFRTRSDNSVNWINNYKDQLKSMVDETRKVYHGLLTYDMAYDALTARNYYGPGSDYLWDDMDLDVIGISAYFPLTLTASSLPLQLDQAKTAWSQIFKDNLVPLQTRNPSKKILFLEFGYTNDVGSPYHPSSQEFTTRSFQDVNTNSLDDGEETQANAYKGFFEINEANDRLVKGAFLWGNEIMSDSDYEKYWNTMVHFGIREKLSEQDVTKYYSDVRDLPHKPATPTGDTMLCADADNSIYSTEGSLNASDCSWSITPTDAGTITANNLDATIDWNSAFVGYATIRVAGKNNFGEGRYSDSLAVHVLPKPVADFDLTVSGHSLIADNKSSGATSYSWNFNNGQSTSTDENPTFTVAESSYVEITLEASNGVCSNTKDVQLTVEITGITESTVHDGTLIYPNPVKDLLNVESVAGATIRMLNQLGQVLLTRKPDSNSTVIDLRQYAPGLYLVSVHDSNGYLISLSKILKE